MQNQRPELWQKRAVAFWLPGDSALSSCTQPMPALALGPSTLLKPPNRSIFTLSFFQGTHRILRCMHDHNFHPSFADYDNPSTARPKAITFPRVQIRKACIRVRPRFSPRYVFVRYVPPGQLSFNPRYWMRKLPVKLCLIMFSSLPTETCKTGKELRIGGGRGALLSICR